MPHDPNGSHAGQVTCNSTQCATQRHIYKVRDHPRGLSRERLIVKQAIASAAAVAIICTEEESAMITRRNMLLGTAALSALPALGNATQRDVLRASTIRQRIAPEPYAETDLWSFGGSFPGRTLRYKQGERLSLDLVNDLPAATSVHWHGIRIDNAMDGVPGLTQPAIPAGDTFTYDFALPDAGTYWYHSHLQAVEQMERGLYGALIVEEADAPDVDRDLVLMLDDIRFTDDAQVDPEFDGFFDRSHGGRIGNVALVNGKIDESFDVKRGDRLRLRLISAANARIFELSLQGMNAHVVAYDGMPLIAPQPLSETFSLAPSQRIDLIVDITDDSDAYLIQYERDGGYAAVHFNVSGGSDTTRSTPDALPPNPDFPIDLANAETLPILIAGGAMAGLDHAMYKGTRMTGRELAQENMFWALNGQVGRTETPLIEVSKGQTVRIGMANDTAFPHAMHLHGMHFAQVLADGTLGPLRDTILIESQGQIEIAFNAHNPGDWLFHCHMLSHHAAGMGSFIRVI